MNNDAHSMIRGALGDPLTEAPPALWGRALAAEQLLYAGRITYEGFVNVLDNLRRQKTYIESGAEYGPRQEYE